MWDEVVAWIVLVAGPWPRSAPRLRLVLFRLFDAVKIGPMAWADEAFNGLWLGGFGVMLDDRPAAFCTLLVIAARRF